MKIAVAANGNTLEAAVDPRFGRCAWFVIVDSDSMEYQAVENPGVTAGGGAGIQAAQVVASFGVQAVVAGNMGPNAYRALSGGGIQVLPWTGGTVRQAVEAVKSGQVTPTQAPTVASHFGTGGAPGLQAGAAGAGMGQGTGRGRGGGMGQGAGMGRGAGLGRGQAGGGRGQGRGFHGGR